MTARDWREAPLDELVEGTLDRLSAMAIDPDPHPQIAAEFNEARRLAHILRDAGFGDPANARALAAAASVLVSRVLIGTGSVSEAQARQSHSAPVSLQDISPGAAAVSSMGTVLCMTAAILRDGV